MDAAISKEKQSASQKSIKRIGKIVFFHLLLIALEMSVDLHGGLSSITSALSSTEFLSLVGTSQPP
jgi:hypothetical protein